MPLPHQVDRPPYVVILSIMYSSRASILLGISKAICTRRTALSLAQKFAFLSQVMVTRRLVIEYVDEDLRTEGSISRGDDFASPGPAL